MPVGAEPPARSPVVPDAWRTGVWALPWTRAPWSVVDLEMTGLDRLRDRICEVGVVQVHGEVVGERWSSLVRPEVRMKPRARAVHGIEDAELAKAPTFDAVVPQLLPRLEGRILVGHNAAFDLDYLVPALTRAGQKMPAAAVVDTLVLARRMFAFSRNGLATVSAALGVTPGRAHRALGDAETTWRVLQRMLRLWDPTGERTVGELLAGLAHLKPGGGAWKARRQALKDALSRQETVVISYLSRTVLGDPGTAADAAARTVQQRELAVWRVGKRKVQGFCHFRGAERVFHLDRVESVTAAGRAYTVPMFRSRV